MNKILILLILVTTIGYAQRTKIDKNITIDLEELNLKGNVKRVAIYEKTMDVDTTAIISDIRMSTNEDHCWNPFHRPQNRNENHRRTPR